MQDQSVLCSKHELLEKLRLQMSHINDVAAWVYHWFSCQIHGWGTRWVDGVCFTGDVQLEHLEAVNRQIHHALSLSHVGYLDFVGNVEDPDNKANEFRPFKLDNDDAQHHLEFVDLLSFICTLYRLQQLHPGAVLARLHGIFSRCCRCDLILATRVLCLDIYNPIMRAEYRASKREVPSSDILIAFGQSEPYVKKLVSVFTAAQRERMRACVQTMVDT